jgi:hypothetical protein
VTQRIRGTSFLWTSTIRRKPKLTTVEQTVNEGDMSMAEYVSIHEQTNKQRTRFSKKKELHVHDPGNVTGLRNACMANSSQP